MNNISNIPQSLNETLINSNLTDVTIDAVEAEIDNYLENGLLKDIPIVSSIVGVIKTTQNISSYLLLKKIVAFLNGIKSIDPKKRQKMITDIDNSDKYRIKVGEKLLYIIDRCNDHEKAEYIAMLFCGLVNEKINYFEFDSATHIVNNLPVILLKDFLLMPFEEIQTLPPHIAERYVHYGLYYMVTGMNIELFGKDMGKEKNNAKITHMGKIIHGILNFSK